MKSVLVRPLITEKMSGISEKHAGKYGFMVAVDANKIEIAKALKAKFNVDVTSVNTIRYKGKAKTQLTKKGRFTGRTPKFKKAIVTLKEGQTLDIFGQA
ncbi:MAG: 50S ribosomal protein L23 [Melioribacteraceae bacterium]|jgi:large subunit ribosomal protein L23